MRRIRLSLIAATALIAGCSGMTTIETPPIAIPGVEPIRAKPVSLFDRRLALGSFEPITMHNEEGELTCPRNYVPLGQEVQYIQRYHFRISSAAGALNVACTSTSRTEIFKLVANSYNEVNGYPRLDCLIEGTVPGTLTLTTPADKPELGTARLDGHEFQIDPVHSFPDGSDSWMHRPRGYRISDGENLVAALEVNAIPAYVWLASSDELTRLQLAAAAVALMNHHPREADPENDCKLSFWTK